MKYVLASLFAPVLIVLFVLIFLVFSIFFLMENLMEINLSDHEQGRASLWHDLATYLSMLSKKHS